MEENMRRPYVMFIIVIVVVSLIYAIGKTVYNHDKEEGSDSTVAIKNQAENLSSEEESKQDEEKTIQQMYEKAYNLYWEIGFSLGEETKIKQKGKQVVAKPITYYEETVNAVFSEKGRKVFEERKDNIVKQEETYYLLNNTLEKDESHQKTVFKKVETTQEEMTYLAEESYEDGSNKKNIITLIKENGTWKVDEFTLADVKE